MGKAEHQRQQVEVSQYYFDYLKDAAVIFEGAIECVKQSKNKLCDMTDAIDMAHRIKGNAAMYDCPELGLKAEKIEEILRLESNSQDNAKTLPSLIKFVDEIQDICHIVDKSRSPKPRLTLAVENKEPARVSQSTADSFDRKSVLFTYQDIRFCDAISRRLEPQFDIVKINSESSSLKVIGSHKPDIVFLEDTFDGRSGLDLLKDLKSSQKLMHIPVFISFDSSAHESIAEAISLGVAGFSTDKDETLEIAQFAKDYFDKPPQSILVVDDDPVVRNILKYTLKSAGFKVDMASDGIEALTYLSDNKPDLVLLDRFMPRLEGGTVLYEIRNKINLKSIPVLILTAMVNRGEAKSWFERGAADFIPKPFDPEEVLMRVKQHLETRQSLAC